MTPQNVIVLSPAGLCHASVAIAACRAGARGFIDLEHAASARLAAAAIAQLDQSVSGPFGIKLGREQVVIQEGLLANPPARLAAILLAGGATDDLQSRVALFRERGIDVFFEAISIAEALHASAFGVSGIVLKGHEAGGRVGSETAFVLLQHWFAQATGNALPVWAQGGVGLNTAAACMAAGAAGVVLDSQILLARETPLDEDARQRLAVFDGSETICLGEQFGEAYRFHYRPGISAIDELRKGEEQLAQAICSDEEKKSRWREMVRAQLATGGLWPLGQDACFAKPLADHFVTVAGIVQAVCHRADEQLDAARRLKPLAVGAPLAARHNTRYPLVQGPMTRVSDTATFADAVMRAGALPFLALALSGKAEVETLLRQTRDAAAGRAWGAGILGFVPAQIREQQIDAIRACPPPFALIAGGRPDQARELEQDGIVTYLHVPSPGLLRMFLKQGSRHFVFEGSECGGHVGPRTSFVLWESMCELVLEHISSAGRGDDLHVIFAGGIHDARSAAMVSALGARLAQRGVAIGALMGTAYLFTHEAVAAGAIVPRFQQEALGCEQTVLLKSGAGHAIRCIDTPYCDLFEAERRRLSGEGKSQDEVVQALEWMNIGRLRIASKGIERTSGNGHDPPDARAFKKNGGDRASLTESYDRRSAGFALVPEQDQHERGMYMIGQVACLRSRVLSIAQLHEEVSAGGERLLGNPDKPAPVQVNASPRPCDIAIIGMACFFPKAPGLTAYWENILNKLNAIVEIPATHWDWRLYYDADPRAPDKIISKWGGFLDDITFDPLNYGIAPNSLSSIEPLQLYLLEAVRGALADAGYASRPYDRQNTCAILGIGGSGNPLAVSYGFRTCLPLLGTVDGLGLDGVGLDGLELDLDRFIERTQSLLPAWTEDSFPGILPSVAAGRIANRFDLGGANYAIDAACGSSLAAVQACIHELETGTSNLALAMAADMVQTPYAYTAFSKTHALSPRGQCRPFDAGADGIVLSEGVAALVLKRRGDAVRDGDRIYAVIRGVGASSDGRDKGLTAPRLEGQLLALRRAYAQAGVSPARVGLIEAHGTGTITGDQTEAQALNDIFRETSASLQSCAVGSSKSLIGHSKCAAGMAGLIKTALALHHKILPPTLIENPNAKCSFDDSPLYLNGEARPWVHGSEQPRCAGVSAFGFGGTNFHVVLEEHADDLTGERTTAFNQWPAELLLWRRRTPEELLQAVEQCQKILAAGAKPTLAELALALCRADRAQQHEARLAIVAASLDDLAEKLGIALNGIRGGASINDPRGIYYGHKPEEGGKIAFIFPGQGSQYPNMLRELAMTFAEVRDAFSNGERLLSAEMERPLGRAIFPPTAFSPEREDEFKLALTQTEIAQPAVATASLGVLHLLHRLGLAPDFVAGHSLGEYVALAASGALDEDDLIRLAHRRGMIISQASLAVPAGMAALDADAGVVEALIAGIDGATIANRNAPAQTVISGADTVIEAALAKAREEQIHGRRIPVACGFHSPLVASARAPLARALDKINFRPPRCPVFSNVTAAPYPADPSGISALLLEHLVSPVRFHDQILAMHAAGARLFVELGPQMVLTGLVDQILAGKPHVAVACDIKGRSGLLQLAHALGRLLAWGAPIELSRLYATRSLRQIELADLPREAPASSSSTWVINSVRSRPLQAPEPRLLGQPAMISPRRVQPAHHSAQRQGPNRTGADSEAIIGVGTQPAVADEATQVMLGHQALMAKFLETQKSVMAAYLRAEATTMIPMPGLPKLPSLAQPTIAPVPIQQQPRQPGERKPDAREPLAVDRAWLTTQLIDLVSKRTGYPKEMLGLDQNLEADLGIDSIKRVEILGNLAERMYGDGSGVSGRLEMEKLTGLKTFRSIVDYIDNALAGIRDTAKPQNVLQGERLGHSPAQSTQEYKHLPVQRALIRLIDAPLPASRTLAFPRGVVLFTDDCRGIAAEMAGRLTDLGQQAVLVRHHEDAASVELSNLRVDLGNADAIDALLAHVRKQHGPIAGLIHLLPLAPASAGEEPWRRMQRDVKSLYLLARGLRNDLRQAVGSTIVLAATGLGGGLGFAAPSAAEDYFAGHGGVIGFIKCLALEWPEALVRVVDVDVRGPKGDLAQCLLAELTARGGPAEVGYLADRGRVTWAPVAAPIERGESADPVLSSDSTVLISGGARGITAAVAVEIAERYRCNLIIVGRSPLPAESEASETAALSAPAEIKSAIIAAMQRDGEAVRVADVEARFNRIMREREMRNTLSRIAQSGGRAHYFQVDVRERDAMTRLLAEIESRFGGLDALIHGAGVMEDKLIEDKTPDSFDRVFNTKAASALLLSECLNQDRLKLCVFFVSITGRYGNKGQSDYAAANETVSKLALHLDRLWRARVVAVAWGPWSQIGMTADLEKHLTQRGLQMISPEQGPKLLLDELVFGRKGETEVIIARATEDAASREPSMSTMAQSRITELAAAPSA